MAEFVTIQHPSLPEAEPARVTKRAFELIHEPKGWEVVAGDAPAETTAPTSSPTLVQQIAAATKSAAEKAADKAPAEPATEPAADKAAKTTPAPGKKTGADS